MWTFCLLQYVIFQLITETPRVKNVTPRCISPPLCDQVAPPTMLFSLHAIHPFILHANAHFLCPPPLRSHDHTISPSSYSSSVLKPFFSPSVLPTFLSSFLQIDLSSASLSVNLRLRFHSCLILSSFHISPFLYHPYSHPTPLFSASLQWQVLWEKGWLCQCQAIPSNDNVYYPLCLPLPMD